MKKIILSALLLLSNIAFAQTHQLVSSNKASTPSMATIDMPPLPPVSAVTVKSPNVLKATWQDKTYLLTEKDIKENNKYETVFSFYRDKQLVTKIKGVHLANFPSSISSIQETKYIASLSKKPDSDKLVATPGILKSGLDITYLIIPSDGDDTSVLVRDYISAVDLIAVQKVFAEDKVNYTEEPKTSVNLHNQTSLVPVGREVILVQWGNEDIRVIVKKVK